MADGLGGQTGLCGCLGRAVELKQFTFCNHLTRWLMMKVEVPAKLI
jgi:hypothetical protein